MKRSPHDDSPKLPVRQSFGVGGLRELNEVLPA